MNFNQLKAFGPATQVRLRLPRSVQPRVNSFKRMNYHKRNKELLIFPLSVFIHLAMVQTNLVIIALGNLFTFCPGRYLMSGPCALAFCFESKHELLTLFLETSSFGTIYSFWGVMTKRIFRFKRKVWPNNPHGQKGRYPFLVKKKFFQTCPMRNN